MVNPATIMKIMGAKNKFSGNHPKFIAFVKEVVRQGLTEGTIIEVKVTKPGQEPLAANMQIQQSDMELMDELKTLL